MLCDPTTPFERDPLGLRRQEARDAMHGRYRERIESMGAPSIEVRGTLDQRVAQVDAALERLE